MVTVTAADIEVALAALSVKQLKAALQRGGLSASGCVERADLVGKARTLPRANLVELVYDPGANASASANANANANAQAHKGPQVQQAQQAQAQGAGARPLPVPRPRALPRPREAARGQGAGVRGAAPRAGGS
jgi:hypothetical protein